MKVEMMRMRHKTSYLIVTLGRGEEERQFSLQFLPSGNVKVRRGAIVVNRNTRSFNTSGEPFVINSKHLCGSSPRERQVAEILELCDSGWTCA